MYRILSSLMKGPMLLTTIVLLALMLPLGNGQAAMGPSDKFSVAEVTTRKDQAAENVSAKVQAAAGTSEGAHLASKPPSLGAKSRYAKQFGSCARTRNAQRLSARLATRPGGGS